MLWSPTQVTVPENMDAIYSIILNSQRISTEKISDTLVINWERVGYIIHKILDMTELSAKWVAKCLNAV
jgi:hypothetical protein